MSEIAIQVTNLAKEYRIGSHREPYQTLRETFIHALQAPWRRLNGQAPETHKRFWALKDVNLSIGQGEVVGVIGRNGAGKSTLLKILSRITAPTKGQIEIVGRVGSLLEVGTGFHPELTGRENIFVNGAILGMKRAEIARKLDEIIAFAEIGDFLDTPIKRYSSGMNLRLAFAVAAHLHPEILLVDEVLAVGDHSFQQKCLGKVDEIAKGGRTVVFVSHQMSQIRRLCGRVIWLRNGLLEADGSPLDVINRYEVHMIERNDAHAVDNNCFLGWRFFNGGNVLENTDDTVVLCIDVNVPVRVIGGHFGASIIGDDGRIVASWAFDEISLPASRIQLTLKLDSLPIRPGNYSLQFSLFNHGNNLTGGKVLEIWHAAPRLIINSELFGHPQDRWAGPLNIKASLTSSL